MLFSPNPLLYSANEDFYSSFRLVLTLRDPVRHDVLSRAVSEAMVRYPYFSVTPKKEGESLVLAHNPLPVPVFEDGRCPVLGTRECGGHLLTFGCEGKKLFLNASHYLTDGVGISPLLKTLLYLYVTKIYGTKGLEKENFLLPEDTVEPGEYSYPFEGAPKATDPDFPPVKAPTSAYVLRPDLFEGGGLYAYQLHVPQRAMMEKANPADGSPVSFLSVLLYRALCRMDGNISDPVVVHVQHQYRPALGAFSSRHSLVCYIPVTLSPKLREWSVERQNTVMRGQIILGSQTSADLEAVNRLVRAMPEKENATLTEKKRAMQRFVKDSIKPKTFGISYAGKMDWCGLEEYLSDVQVYIGEKDTRNMLLIEVFTVGEDFSVNLMQGGKTRRFADALIAELEALDIPVRLTGEGPYSLSATRLPE